MQFTHARIFTCGTMAIIVMAIVMRMAGKQIESGAHGWGAFFASIGFVLFLLGAPLALIGKLMSFEKTADDGKSYGIGRFLYIGGLVIALGLALPIFSLDMELGVLDLLRALWDAV